MPPITTEDRSLLSQWRREKRGNNPPEGWIVKVLTDFYDSHPLAKRIFKVDKDKPRHLSDAADDPFGGDDEVDPSGDASEDLTRKQFVSETRSYHRKKKWNECKEQGGHRFLLDHDEFWASLTRLFGAPGLARGLAAVYLVG